MTRENCGELKGYKYIENHSECRAAATRNAIPYVRGNLNDPNGGYGCVTNGFTTRFNDIQEDLAKHKSDMKSICKLDGSNKIVIRHPKVHYLFYFNHFVFRFHTIDQIVSYNLLIYFV